MTEKLFSLTGKTVIITGGGGLLGREYARATAAAGANVVIADIDPDGANTAAAEVKQAGYDTVLPLAVDVSDKASVQAMVQRTLDAFGRVDGLVNNAAINPKFDVGEAQKHTITFEDFPLDTWNESLAVNLTGMFLCAQVVAGPMLAQGSGSIINVSSTYGLTGPDQRLYERDDPDEPISIKPVTYTVTKSAVIGLTKYLAVYWGDKGIRVNTLTPGGTFNAHEEQFVRRYSAKTPMGRMAHKHEYNGAVVYLLSDASSYMTGSNLVVDGGWTAW